VTKKNKNINQTSKELSILASSYGLSFVVKNAGNQEKKFFEYTFDSIHSAGLFNKLEEIFTDRNLDDQSFENITILHHNLLNSLVPLEFFDENKPKEFLETNIKLLETDTVEFDVLKSYRMVNVFVPFTPLYQFLSRKTEKLISRHSMSRFLEKIWEIRQKNIYMPVFEIYLNIYKKDFQIVVFKNDQVQLTNQFPYENTDEFLYYLFFVWETLNINNENMHIYISGIDKQHEIIDNLSDFTRNYSVLPSSFASSINNYILD